MPITPIDKQTFGEGGCELKTTAAFTAGEYCALQFVTDGSLSIFTAPLATGTFTSQPFPAGFVIFTPFTAATLATGTAIAYKAL
jgi:hypothetical protein